MASQHLKVKSTLNRLEIIKHLENLATSLKEGTICIQKGEKYVALKPCEPVTLELEAEVKVDKDVLREKLTIELKWKKSEIIQEEEETFVISHQDPTQDEEN